MKVNLKVSLLACLLLVHAADFWLCKKKIKKEQSHRNPLAATPTIMDCCNTSAASAVPLTVNPNSACIPAAFSEKRILLKGERHHIADLQVLLQLKQAAAYNHCCYKTHSFETDYIWTNKLLRTLTSAGKMQYGRSMATYPPVCSATAKKSSPSLVPTRRSFNLAGS